MTMNQIRILIKSMLLILALYGINIWSQDENEAWLLNYNSSFYISSEDNFTTNDTIPIKIYTDASHIKSSIFEFTLFKVNDPVQYIIKNRAARGYYDLLMPSDYSKIPDIAVQVVTFERSLFKNGKGYGDNSIHNDTTLKFPPLSKGLYIVQVKNKKRISCIGFIISNIALVTKYSNNMLLCFTADKITGEPVENVNLNIEKSANNVNKIITGSDGIAVYTISDLEKSASDYYNYQSLIVRPGRPGFPKGY